MTIMILAFISLAALALAQNITVNETSPLIQYSGDVGDASICKYNANGTLVGGQPGCYNIPSECTANVAMGQSQNGTASFSFKGSAISINSALYTLSPLYTVTLDGTPYDADGWRSSGAFTCDTLFSQSGLDATVEHQITLSIKGNSPKNNQTSTDGITNFSLISFVYSTDASNSSSSSASGSSTASSTVPATSTPVSASRAMAEVQMPSLLIWGSLAWIYGAMYI
ncbi:hypothetical protein FIBSPDRAFT_848979 [Athelia psychrophila]|uniref:Uncharacterized protein n=1 Tax=Athelia psychrophila TaxID=1759441 RepID=A0A166UTT5_9AGAM|nr:hypothetical protein FIBSPDRAFT_848979 [Fibularhizoctonia sp. CBS 109695]